LAPYAEHLIYKGRTLRWSVTSCVSKISSNYDTRQFRNRSAY